MVKRRKISDFSGNSPQFFKVYLPNQSSHRLQIPPAFVKHFSVDFPCKSTIASLEKRSWHVELQEVDGHVYFQEGWEQFVHDNSLEFGDFLLFDYGSDAQFCVQIYGKNGSRKDISGPSKEIDRETTQRHNQTVERRKSGRLAQGANGKEISHKEWCPRSSMGIQEGGKAHKEDKKFVSKFPFFEVVMTPSYITKGFMNIPSSFHRYMEEDRHGLILVASDRSLPVKLIKHCGRIWRFGLGWSTFCRENKLKEGDVCAFELIEKNDFVLKVSVFR